MEIGRGERERERNSEREREQSADGRCCHGEVWTVVKRRGRGGVVLMDESQLRCNKKSPPSPTVSTQGFMLR